LPRGATGSRGAKFVFYGPLAFSHLDGEPSFLFLLLCVALPLVLRQLWLFGFLTFAPPLLLVIFALLPYGGGSILLKKKITKRKQRLADAGKGLKNKITGGQGE
jgi:hypothetical protein